MGGRNRQAEMAQARLSGAFESAMREQMDMARRNIQRMEQYQQPMVDFYGRIVSGDRQAMMTSAAPLLANYDLARRAYEGNIYESTTYGPVRDYLLGSTARSFNAAKAQVLNELFTSALQGMAGLGAQYGDFGLANLGAATQFGAGAGDMNRTLIDAATQRAAARWGALGQLAGALGYMIGAKAR